VVAALEGGLGPIAEVSSAVRGEMDLTHLCFRHESGATSTATISIKADPRAAHSSTTFLGDGGVVEGRRRDPGGARPPDAVEELMESAASGRAHPADEQWGTHVVELLADAERRPARGAEVGHPGRRQTARRLRP
jgi:hypothetical protein